MENEMGNYMETVVLQGLYSPRLELWALNPGVLMYFLFYPVGAHK